MSLAPYLFDYDSPRWPRRLGQSFGSTINTDDLYSSLTSAAPRYRNWLANETNSTIKSDDDKYTLSVDVQHFAPEEIVVKTVDGFIFVEAKHEEKKDEHGFITRQFSRRFKLPDDYNQEAVESRLSSDGVLTIVAYKKSQLAPGERKVPITPTGPVKKDVKPVPAF